MSSASEPGWSARLFVAIQRLLPTLLLSTGMHHLTRLRWPAFKNAFIRVFMRHFKISLDEALIQDVEQFEHFNAFFTRELKPGARSIDSTENSLICPADGAVSQLGKIEHDQIFQAKGQVYSCADLLGDADWAQQFLGGSFCTIYLAPFNYHRVHAPANMRLQQWRYQPGRLFSVNTVTAQLMPRLFARNERLCATFDTEFGPMAVILVGALLVGGIETVWSGPVTPPHNQDARSYTPMSPFELQRGAELGRFNMGSTVILLSTAGRLNWQAQLQAVSVERVGQKLATGSSAS